MKYTLLCLTLGTILSACGDDDAEAPKEPTKTLVDNPKVYLHPDLTGNWKDDAGRQIEFTKEMRYVQDKCEADYKISLVPTTDADQMDRFRIILTNGTAACGFEDKTAIAYDITTDPNGRVLELYYGNIYALHEVK